MRFSAQLATDRVTKGAEFTTAAAIGEMARALEAAGFAAGYLEGEYRALGADFAGRNESADDALRAMKRAWSGASVRYEGRGYRAEGNTMLPPPIQRPHPPIWVGGNSRRALRRAVEHAQGWSPFPLPAELHRSSGPFGRRTRTAAIESIEDLAARIRELRDGALEAGRGEPLDVNFVPFGLGMNPRALPDADGFCEQALRLEEIGVSWLSVGVPGASRAAYCENAARFGAEVIARLRRVA